MLFARMDVRGSDVDHVAANGLGASNSQLQVLQLAVQTLCADVGRITLVVNNVQRSVVDCASHRAIDQFALIH